MQLKVIFVPVVVHQASLVSRALVIVQLVNCPFFPFTHFQFCPAFIHNKMRKIVQWKRRLRDKWNTLTWKGGKYWRYEEKCLVWMWRRRDCLKKDLCGQNSLESSGFDLQMWELTSYYFVGFWLWRQRLTCIPLSRVKMIFFSIL